MPQDNHSLMQFYLDDKKKFLHIFFWEDKFSYKIKNNKLMNSQNHLRNKSLNSILYTQCIATQNIFKKIPFRSFLIKKMKVLR